MRTRGVEREMLTRKVCTSCGRVTYHPVGAYNIFDNKTNYHCPKCVGSECGEELTFIDQILETFFKEDTEND